MAMKTAMLMLMLMLKLIGGDGVDGDDEVIDEVNDEVMGDW